jgi:hypothetical protein
MQLEIVVLINFFYLIAVEIRGKANQVSNPKIMRSLDFFNAEQLPAAFIWDGCVKP